MKHGKCKGCGGPLPEKHLLVVGSLKTNKGMRSAGFFVSDAEGFHYISRVNHGVCGHWCALAVMGRKMEETLDGVGLTREGAAA